MSSDRKWIISYSVQKTGEIFAFGLLSYQSIAAISTRQNLQNLRLWRVQLDWTQYEQHEGIRATLRRGLDDLQKFLPA